MAGIDTELPSVFKFELDDANEAARESGGVLGVGVVDPDDEGETEELVDGDEPDVE